MSDLSEEQSPIVVDYERSFLCQRGPLTVFRSFDAELGVPVVVKRVALGQELSRLGRLRTEATLMRAVEDHPNLLKCYVDRFSETHDHYELVLESGSCSLADLVRERALSQEEIFTHFSQIAAGLSALHARGIVHRDLKADNIILVDGVAKIADFGEAVLLSSAPSKELAQVRGTAGFMAPEIIRGEGCSPASDLWSLGALLYELVQRQHPFSCMEPQAVMFQVGARSIPCLTSQPLFDDLILLCQAPKPEERPTAAQVLAHFSSFGY